MHMSVKCHHTNASNLYYKYDVISWLKTATKTLQKVFCNVSDVCFHLHLYIKQTFYQQNLHCMEDIHYYYYLISSCMFSLLRKNWSWQRKGAVYTFLNCLKKYRKYVFYNIVIISFILYIINVIICYYVQFEKTTTTKSNKKQTNKS